MTAPLDVVDRWDAEAAWVRLPEAARTAIGAAVLSGLAACELLDHAAETGDMRYQRVGLAAEAKAEDEMERLLAEVSTSALAGLDLPSGAPRIPSLIGMVCERCGCSAEDACPGRCAWARDNLCTTCAPRVAAPAAA